MSQYTTGIPSSGYIGPSSGYIGQQTTWTGMDTPAAPPRESPLSQELQALVSNCGELDAAICQLTEALNPISVRGPRAGGEAQGLGNKIANSPVIDSLGASNARLRSLISQVHSIRTELQL